MNLILFDASELSSDGSLILAQDRRHAHLQSVLKVEVGSTLRVGQINGLCGSGTVEHIGEHIGEHSIRLQVELSETPPAALDLTLVLALPRPKMLRRILRGIAEVGVKDLHLINSYRVEKSYWQSPLLEAKTLQNTLLAGLEQAGDTVLPEVHQHQRFRPFAEDRLAQLIEGREALLAEPGAEALLPASPILPGLLAVGPEGGFIPFETELLQRIGCRPVSMGPRILRVETAVQCALGRYLPGD